MLAVASEKSGSETAKPASCVTTPITGSFRNIVPTGNRPVRIKASAAAPQLVPSGSTRRNQPNKVNPAGASVATEL
jgi:hypothetical protein